MNRFDKSMVEDYDEIKNCINSRYISSIEAYWRLKGFKLHGRLLAVIRLPLHQENQQKVMFKCDNLNKIFA